MANNLADYLLDRPEGLAPTAAAFALLSMPDPPEQMSLSWRLGHSTHTLTAARAMLRHAPPPVDEDGWFRILPDFLTDRYKPAQKIVWILLRRHAVNGRTGDWARHITYGVRSLHRAIGDKYVGWNAWQTSMKRLREDLWITPSGMSQVGLVIPSASSNNSLSVQNNSLSVQIIPSASTNQGTTTTFKINQPRVDGEGIKTSTPLPQGVGCEGPTPWGGCRLLPGQLPQCIDCPRLEKS